MHSQKGLNTYEKQKLINRLSRCNPELFYDNFIHNKVFDKIDAYILIPKGIKSLLWYTYYKRQNVCILINLNKYNKIENLQLYQSCFSNELATSESLFIGYQAEMQDKYNHVFFVCTNIVIYKGKRVEYISYIDKLMLFKEIFARDIRQLAYCNNTLIVGLPIIINSLDNIQVEMARSAYKVYGLEYILYNKNKSLGISLNLNQNRVRENQINKINKINNLNRIEAIFKVKAALQDDIYNLYYYDKGSSDNFHNIALINNYNTSVFMNSLFRKIKENQNLDLLEESDDEEEFENISEDKFVDLNKSLSMKCVFNNRFKKWEPVEVVESNKIINMGEIINFERNTMREKRY